MASQLFRIDGKIALVTGGSRGLGLDMAEGFLEAGAAKVYISSRKANTCNEAVEYLNKTAAKAGQTGRAYAIPADASSDEGIKHLLEEFSKKESKLDILVANAGVTWGADLASHPSAAFDKVLGTNIKGVFLTIREFVPLLEAAGTAEDPSRVLVTGSIAGIRNGISGGTYGYIASKAGVHHMAKALAVELGPENITVNIIAPGFFPTKMSNGLLEVIGDEMIASNPRGRLGQSRDIIGAAVYLVSPASAYVNGTVLPIDGGSHLSGKI